ncbi:hypothetical protein CC78DRAFT_535186 [Lojkania enalia]|uniref:Homeobox and C2H2 transcription factor n=1 Tax=Lojkania enalia TaxID=147567 RepID=A0A9P4N132_9PLEO|nr:hypothetical protein CC78DRAFT_535186 [Didymosphaeria enalia]
MLLPDYLAKNSLNASLITIRWQCQCSNQDFDLPEGPQVGNSEQEWNSNFSNWIPRYSKAAHPCDYCRSRSLECFILDGFSGCSPCNALFRPCSFSQPKNDRIKSKTALDTLDVVTEDSAQLFGGLTGKRPMRCLGHVGPIEADEADKGPKKGAAAARFPRAAVKILKDWMIEHLDHPYPTEEEKESLKEQTGLTIGQISNWMANTRRRQKARPKRSASPSIRPSTEAINIPPGRTWESLNPFERWKHSPPENEPAPMTAIAQAVENFDPPEPNSLSSSFTGRKGNSNDSTGSFSVFRAPSTTSLETGFTNMSSGSAQSLGSAWSYGSRNSLGSLNSLSSKKERRRRRRLPTRTPKQLDLELGTRIFHCTFCTDRFKSKYDWSRHEKSLHLSLEKWICAPLGDVITCSSSGQRKCVYCDALNPTTEHLESHNHRACEEKGLEARTFYRKDHLRQHLRLMHGCKMTASMESWKAEAQFINSRCGFCGMTFEKWQDRVDHLAKEFRNGATMKDWKGCRGLDAHIAALVTNAMPPYLIANESKSPFPFSATNSASMKHHALYLEQTDLEFLLPTDKKSPTTGVFLPHHMGDVSLDSSDSPTIPAATQNNSSLADSLHPNPNATCWEILTLRLGRFARQHIEQHGPNSVTDEVLQQQARHILYDCDDPWNQTAADNPEWLALFKKAHGIDNSVPYPSVISQHEILEDLGLRPNANLDKSFNLMNFECVSEAEKAKTATALAYECSLAGSTNMTRQAQQLSAYSNFSLPEPASTAMTASNVPATDFSDLGLEASISQLSCGPTSLCFGENDDATNVSTEAPIQELPCTTAGGPLPNNFSFPNWDQLSAGFAIPSTTAAAGLSMPVSSGLANMDVSGAEVVQGSMENPQVMRWDDVDLAFNLDMDMDIDTHLDLIMGPNGTTSQ